MNPQQQGGTNPYAGLLQQMQQKFQGGGGQPGGAPQAPQTPQGGGGSALQQAQLAPQGAGGIAGAGLAQGGAPGSATKFLLSALQNLNSFVQQSGDPQETVIVRSLIKLLTELISRDQTRAHQASQPPEQGTSIGAQTPPPGGRGMAPGAGGQPSPMGR